MDQRSWKEIGYQRRWAHLCYLAKVTRLPQFLEVTSLDEPSDLRYLNLVFLYYHQEINYQIPQAHCYWEIRRWIGGDCLKVVEKYGGTD
jgi:hypothetical protein